MYYGRFILTLALAAALVGCRPSSSNVALRKENQKLNERVALLELQIKARQAFVPVTQPAFERSFTVHDVTLGKLTNANNERLKIYVEPRDEEGAPIKAPGDLIIDAYDVSVSPNVPLDHWEIPAEELRPRWRQLMSLNAFVLERPWNKTPNSTEIGVTVRYKDALTHRMYYVVGKVAWEP